MPQEQFVSIVDIVTTLGLPTAFVVVLMWYQMKRETQADGRQAASEAAALKREERMAARITDLETVVNSTLMETVKEATAAQVSIGDALRELSKDIAGNTNVLEAIAAKPALPCFAAEQANEANEAKGPKP